METDLDQPIPPSRSAFLPVFLIALTVLIFMSWQFWLVCRQQVALKALQKDRNSLVQKSKVVQDDLQKLAVGLIEIARGGDQEAATLVQKYGISQSQPTR
jgi:hypothetical protein